LHPIQDLIQISYELKIGFRQNTMRIRKRHNHYIGKTLI
jgi:hypothetical protein